MRAISVYYEWSEAFVALSYLPEEHDHLWRALGIWLSWRDIRHACLQWLVENSCYAIDNKLEILRSMQSPEKVTEIVFAIYQRGRFGECNITYSFWCGLDHLRVSCRGGWRGETLKIIRCHIILKMPVLTCNAYVTNICFGSLNTWTLYGTRQLAGLYFRVCRLCQYLVTHWKSRCIPYLKENIEQTVQLACPGMSLCRWLPWLPSPGGRLQKYTCFDSSRSTTIEVFRYDCSQIPCSFPQMYCILRRSAILRMKLCSCLLAT